MVAVSGCARAPESNKVGLTVAASIAPLLYFSREIGGSRVDAELLVPPNASPHTYQLTGEQMKLLSRADVLIINGLGLEFWADKAIESADNSRLRVVNTSRRVEVIDSAEDHYHVGGNPHTWLDPHNAIIAVESIRDAFSAADPAGSAYYSHRAEELIARLRELDSDVARSVKGFRYRSFVTFHPAWVYFAHRYGLKEAAVIEKSPGREPSPSELGEVVDAVRRSGARVVFAEPQFSTKMAEVVAREARAKVLLLDPIGKGPDYDYIKTMRANLSAMEEALR